MKTASLIRAAAVVAISAMNFSTGAAANPFFLFEELFQPRIEQPRVEQPMPGTEETFQAPARFRRQVVDYRTAEAPGTIIIDTPNTYLYLVLGNGQALSYGIGVGRVGFTWSGVTRISAKREWPAWTPPAQMRQRRPICRATWPAASTTRSARVRCISGRACTASTARTSRRPSARRCRRAASG